MTPFNLQHLKYFYDTIRLGGVSQAALENHVSQSAVSQGITKLETCLNKQLLIHRRNRIQITDMGRSVFNQSGSVFQAVQSLQASINAPEEECSGQIVVGCTHSLAQSALINVIQKLATEAPKAQLKLRFGHATLIKQWIGEGSIDFGIALDNEDLSAFETTLLHRGRFDLFRDANKPLTSLITEAIFTEPRPEVHNVKRAYLERYGIELRTAMEVSSWETIATLVYGSHCVGFIPDYLLFHPDRTKHLVPCDLDLPEASYCLFIVRDRAVPLSRSSELFLKMVKDAFDSDRVDCCSPKHLSNSAPDQQI